MYVQALGCGCSGLGAAASTIRATHQYPTRTFMTNNRNDWKDQLSMLITAVRQKDPSSTGGFSVDRRPHPDVPGRTWTRQYYMRHLLGASTEDSDGTFQGAVYWNELQAIHRRGALRGYGDQEIEETEEAPPLPVEEPTREIPAGAIVEEGKGVLVYWQSPVALDQGTAEMFADQIEAMGTHQDVIIEMVRVVSKEGVYYAEALLWVDDVGAEARAGGTEQTTNPPGFIRLANEADLKTPISKGMIYGGIAAGVAGLVVLGTAGYFIFRKK